MVEARGPREGFARGAEEGGHGFCLEAFFLTTQPAAVYYPRLPFCLSLWLPRRRRVRLRLPDGVECVCGGALVRSVISLGSWRPMTFKQRDAFCVVRPRTRTVKPCGARSDCTKALME